MSKNCLICNNASILFYSHTINNGIFREFYLCASCEFIFVPSEFHINQDLEIARYEKHNWQEVNENDFKNSTLSEYDQILEGIINLIILQKIINSKVSITNELNHLDYGCGKYPNLSNLLKWNFKAFNVATRNSISVNSNYYDKYYHSNIVNIVTSININYDLITAIEVVEHFREPLKEFELFSQLLESNANLVVMTEFIPKNILDNIQNIELVKSEFANWWYKNDITHICFYSTKTFEVIAEKFQLEIDFNNRNKVIVLNRL